MGPPDARMGPLDAQMGPLGAQIWPTSVEVQMGSLRSSAWVFGGLIDLWEA